MIEFEVEGDREVVAKLEGLPAEVRARLVPAMGRITLKLMRESVQNKLSGQVLKRRTGTLARSVTQSPRVYQTEQAVVGTVGVENIVGPKGRAPVQYGKTHEFGFKGEVSVKAHLRQIKQAWGKSLKAPIEVTVHAHTRSVDLPERSFLRSALASLEQQGVVREELQRAIEEATR